MMRWFLVLGAVNAFLSVSAGAFGAHALRARLPVDLQVIFETGARYHMYHALGLVAVGLLGHFRPSPLLAGAGWSMLAGIVLFSGSLYALLYAYEAEVMVYFTRTDGLYPALPILAAFVFSLVHGAFAGFFWEVIGIRARRRS